MLFLLLCLLTGAFFIELIRKYIFMEKKPNHEELWLELIRQEWFQELLENQEMKDWINSDKENGLLHDPNYIRKILDKEMHREIFIRYLTDKTKVNKYG
ncbi:hypothetical protein [Alkalihalobacillus deserti]|uniref:hypothetical protein n=1 Tax=Alkalihalobacillus deserti TaxID=2879466 RepID=UPI001D155C86|nr:hypothetical protein [Alkalihalobacillus deserti]